MSCWRVGPWALARRLLAKWTRQRWWAAPWKQRLMALTRPACWSEMTDFTPARPRVRSERKNPARHFVLGVPDVEDEDLSVSVGPAGDDDGLGGDVVVVAHVQVGGVQEDVGELLVVEAAGPKGPDHLVETRTDAADLGLLDPGPDPEGPHQLVDRARRDPAHVGLHHDGIEGLVDTPAGSKMAGKKLPFLSLGMASSTSPALVDTRRTRCPLRSVTRPSLRS